MRRLLAILVAILAGCSAHQKSLTKSTNQSSTRPSNDPSLLSLDQIEPNVRLSQLQPTTNPTTMPSSLALQLYAEGRAAQLERNPARAVDFLRKALELDKNSPEINYALAVAYLASGAGNDLAISRLQRAAELQPDNLDTQLQLGRQYLAKGDYKNAIEHLRLALQTSEFPLRPEAAAVANLLLAK